MHNNQTVVQQSRQNAIWHNIRS